VVEVKILEAMPLRSGYSDGHIWSSFMAKSPASDKSAEPGDHSTAPAPTHQIWLAGLGAMAKAQEQGSKAIEALVNDGLAFQRKSQAEAQQRLHEATERLSHLASDFGQQATVRVDRLEHLFEDRVAKALQRLGMPTLFDLQALTERVAQLEAQLAKATASASARSVVPPSAPKAAVKRAAKSVTPAASKAAPKTAAKATSPRRKA
jgi:poly(hydroxyalkanoate) granule-associated protein